VVQQLYARAVQAHQHGKALEALRLTEEAAQLGVSLSGVHCLRAACLAGLGRFDEARQALALEMALPQPHPEAEKIRAYLDNVTAAKSHASAEARKWVSDLTPDVFKRVQGAHHRYEYKGIPLLKNPFDLSIYPLLLWKLKPRTIFEIGSFSGGSAVWLGDLMNNFDIDGRIYSVDLVRVTRVNHPRVTFSEAPQGDWRSAFTPSLLADSPHPWLVIEDADHTCETTRSALSFFHASLHEGDYFAIEDSIIALGVQQAIAEFLGAHPGEYEVDTHLCDFWGYNVTWCMNGFLKKIR
jgi:cephalosporin hydroxylase